MSIIKDYLQFKREQQAIKAILKVQGLALSQADDERTMKTKNMVMGDELGGTGMSLMSGVISDEYIVALKTLGERATVYSQMRANGTCSALESVITLPLLSASWEIVPPPDGDSTDEQIAMELSQNLFEDMTITWTDLLRLISWAIFSGFQLFEKVFEEIDGQIRWRKWAVRPMQTISGWEYDDTGGISAVKQQGYRLAKGGGNSTEYAEVTIPAEKLIRFTYRWDGMNPEGRGIYRDAYQHWYYLNALRKLAGIRVERTACGTPYVIYDEGTTTETVNALIAMLHRIRTAERSGAALPSTVREVGNFDIGDPGIPFLNLIQNEEQNILRCGLAPFIGMGQGENSGAFAVARDSSSFFLMALNTHAQWICNTISRYAIRQWVIFNYGVRERYPQMVCSSIDARDKYALADMLNQLTQNDLLYRDDEIGERIRELFNLPTTLSNQLRYGEDANGIPISEGGLTEEDTTRPVGRPGRPKPVVSSVDRRAQSVIYRED